MKSKYVLLASTMLISVATFAQKDQIKAAEKALKAGKSDEAKTILLDAETVIINATEPEKAQYYFVKGNVMLDLANKSIDKDNNLSLAAGAFQESIEVEKNSGKSKYTPEASKSVMDIKYKLINEAIADSKTDKYEVAAKKLYDAYQLDKKDTINLYYAASTYVNSKNYDAALKNYDELKKLNYSGKGTNYFAVNKLTSQEDMYLTAAERDRMIKLGTHEKPRTEVIPSKRGEIYKNIALILVQQGKSKEAQQAVADARKANPEDTSLALTEANLYLEAKDFDTYKKLVADILVKNPNDSDLVFNLGVLSANAKNSADAEKYYNRVIEINPAYTNAYINIAALKLENEKPIIDEMNKLGTSTADMKRYDVLKKKREELFRSTIPFLKKAVELDPKNVDVAKTLMNVYSALEMTTEYKELKAKIQ